MKKKIFLDHKYFCYLEKWLPQIKVYHGSLAQTNEFKCSAKKVLQIKCILLELEAMLIVWEKVALL